MRLLALAVVLASSAVAHAQLPANPAPNGPNDLVNPVSIVEGGGIKVGEGTVLHPIVGLETGYVSNVFYTDVGENSSALLRLLVEVQTGSLSHERLQETNEDAVAPAETSLEIGDFQYDFRGYATWDQYLSNNSDVSAQGGLGGGLLLRGLVRPNKPLNFGFMDYYTRLIRATNFESRHDTNRDINRVLLQLNYQPIGRSLGGYLYYADTIDYFESTAQQFANRFQNTLGVRVNWQWLPLTRLYVDVSEGVYTGLGTASTKVNSYPLTAVLGLQTALTVNTTLNARIGYTKGFYANGPDYSSILGGAQITYRFSPLGRLMGLYSYDLQDSINANFYRDHMLQGTLEYGNAPFLVYIRPELHFREYVGVPATLMASSSVRDDVIGAISLGARYMFRDWLAATFDYNFATVQTDFRYMAGTTLDNPSYTRHEVLVGARAAY